MGLISKIKDIFYDPVEDDEDEKVELPKKEFQRSEITRREVKPEEKEEVKIVKNEVVDNVKSENTFGERDLFRSERTFNFTEFDDDDEPEVPAPRVNALEIEKRPARVIETPAREVNTKPKAFKPSPVISPIYGILDKDYVKEEIKERKIEKEREKEKITQKQTGALNYDTVRRKAYGNLEDELEDTMITTPREVRESINNVEKQMDRLNEKTEKIEDLINRIDKENDLTVGQVEEVAKDNYYDRDIMDDIKTKKEETSFDKTVTDDTLEHDLFNLIDSMYDDKED